MVGRDGREVNVVARCGDCGSGNQLEVRLIGQGDVGPSHRGEHLQGLLRVAGVVEADDEDFPRPGNGGVHPDLAEGDAPDGRRRACGVDTRPVQEGAQVG